jgi:hypothetical protein
MKSLGLGSKNMLFIFRFSCLFTFHKHKQRQEVTRPREIATDSTFLTGFLVAPLNQMPYERPTFNRKE